MTASRPQTRRRARTALVAAFGLLGVAVLLSLGAWQTQRLFWKQALIAEMTSRLDAPPLTLTGAETPGEDNFRSASATGRFVADAQPALFLTSLKPYGPGHRLIAPFRLENGAVILVDRGYAPGSEAPPPPSGPTLLTGALHWPRETSSFTPEPNLEKGLWFARDVDKLAAAYGASPVLLALSAPPAGSPQAQATAADGREWPRPIPVGVDLPNDHLGYAITWYSLAAIWLVMTVVAIRRGV